MLCFGDTETTGLPRYNQALDWEGQPHICQLGSMVTDNDGRVKAELNLIIKPEGWTIPPEASAIHGITQEDAEKYGVGIKGALSLLGEFLAFSELFVAHNIEFDSFLIKCAAARAGMVMPEIEQFCTMKSSRDIVKAPLTAKQQAAVFGGYKTPKLQEAYVHFYGKEFEGAHDAMADVRACKDVYFKLLEAA